MAKLRILLADDHETVREGIRLIINAQDDMEVVGEAGDGREAIRLAGELEPDMLIMDISMPVLNGLKAAATLKRDYAGIKILTLTRHTDEAYLKELLQAGVSGYVLKQSASDELLRAIRAIACGGNYLDAAMTGKLFGSMGGRREKMRGETRGENLSERESEVLRHIALGYSNKEVAAQMDISVKTIEAHKANAMRKLEMHSRIDIVRYAILKGWLEDN